MSEPQGWRLSIEQLANGYDKREFSPVEIVHELIGRIEEKQTILNCFISTCFDQALEGARKVTDELLRGERHSALAGIPIGVKDNIDIAGMQTTGGSTVVPDEVRSDSAECVQALDRAGAIIIGKLNMYELAFGDVNPKYGEVRNPWSLAYNCAASSSGPASAVAAGLVHGALGTDTGGSVRLPAAACGVVGIKPTYEMISRKGVLPVSDSLDGVGPIARTVTDVALLLEALSFRSEGTSAGRTGFIYQQKEIERGVRGMVIGVGQLHASEVIDPEVAAGVAKGIEILAKQGAILKSLDVPDYLSAREAMWTISGVEMAEYWGKRIFGSTSVSDEVRHLVSQGAATTGVDYVSARRFQRWLTEEYRRYFDQVDAIVMPVAPMTASLIGKTELDVGGVRESYMALLTRYCPVANVTGTPAVTVPCAISSQGLPIGIQIMSPWNADGTALRVARSIEREQGSQQWGVPREVFLGEAH